MKPFALVAVALALGFQLTGCGAARVGVSGGVRVPPDSQATCSNMCSSVGMSLGAVVVMADNVGCVCSPSRTASLNESGSSTAGGMVAIMIADEERRRQQQQQQQQQSRPH